MKLTDYHKERLKRYKIGDVINVQSLMNRLLISRPSATDLIYQLLDEGYINYIDRRKRGKYYEFVKSTI